MLIKWGALVVDGSGKLGGHVASKNKGGQYLRTKVTPTNPQTSFQTNVRSFFAQLAQGWSGLTQSQRTGWNKAVDLFKRTNVFGDSKSLSGKALYQSLNQNLLVSGQATISAAPSPAEVPSANAVAGVLNTTAGTLTVSTEGDTTGSQIIIRATPPLSAGTSFIKNQLRDLTVVAGGSDVSEDITAAYTARFGAPGAGDNIYVAVKTVNEVGQASPQVSERVTEEV